MSDPYAITPERLDQIEAQIRRDEQRTHANNLYFDVTPLLLCAALRLAWQERDQVTARYAVPQSNADIDAIRARWAGKEWSYNEDQQGGIVVRASLLEDGERVVDLHLPLAAERELLQRLAHAPADVQALLGEVEAARDALDNQSPTLRAAVQAAERGQREMIAAWHEKETELYRRAERAEADIGAWWQIVADLDQLGCLDCSNAACDRAHDALGASHPGAALLAEVEAARKEFADYRAYWEPIHKRMSDEHTRQGGELAIVRELLRQFVGAYANTDAKPIDRVQVDLFDIWLRAARALGIQAAPSATGAEQGQVDRARIKQEMDRLFGEEGK